MQREAAMKQLSIYEADYLNDLETLNQFDQKAIQLSAPQQDETEVKEGKNVGFAANVTEIIIAKEKADSIQMVLPMLSQLNQEQRWLAWIDPPIQLLKKWQEEHKSLAMEEIMILRSSDSISAIELSKRALEAGTCHAVIAWTNSLSNEEFASLEQASSRGNSHGIVLRSR
jgi:cell division inhibitor SulA